MSNNNFVGRIDQIESIDLDHEIEQHFTSQLKKVSLKNAQFQIQICKSFTKPFKFQIFLNIPYGIWSKLTPEVNLAIEFVVKYFTFYKRQSSIGQRLLGLQIKVYNTYFLINFSYFIFTIISGNFKLENIIMHDI